MEIKLENINSQYLSKEQIKLYLEACLDHRITDFQILKDSSDNKIDYLNKEEFEHLKNSLKNSEEDNLFYRVWIYQYEGLKEFFKSNDDKLLNQSSKHNIINFINHQKNNKNIEKDKKSLNFRFRFGKIDLHDLQKENLFYQQLAKNPNVNFDEYKPTEKEITSITKNLKIIFMYINLGVPLLEEDCEVEEIQNFDYKFNNKKPKFIYKYKYEFDLDKIVYYRKITFSLYEKNDNAKCECNINIEPEYLWCFENKETGNKKYCCKNCYPKIKEKEKYKLLYNNKYSIRYFLFCHEPGHNTKKYEYYCKECKRPYCTMCLIEIHKELNKTHTIEEIDTLNLSNYKSFCKEKLEKIKEKKKKNNEIWESINDAGDLAENSLRQRESKAIIDVKNEILARCTFLTSLGYELQRMINEIDVKKKTIEELRKDSNFANYLNMNNMLVEDMKKHYLPNLEYIEKIPLEKYEETFHKIDKKFPEKIEEDNFEENESDSNNLYANIIYEK